MADGTKACEKDTLWTDVHEKSTKTVIQDMPSILKTAEIPGDASPGELSSADCSSDKCRPEASHVMAKTQSSVPLALSPSSSTSLPNFLKVPAWESKLAAGKQSAGTGTAASASQSPATRGKSDTASAKTEDDIKVSGAWLCE